ncbi:helix-turn-helix domain-containing protein [Paenibacillus antri]|nr:helix-turn-helix domain-containing protein [Paenibacillus antri]
MLTRKGSFRSSRKDLKVLLHFFIPYALLLVGFLSVGYYAYERTSQLIESQTKETAFTVMEQTKDILDRRFEEIETIAEQVAGGTKARSFQYVEQPFAGTNPVRILELHKDLFDYPLFNHFILDYFVVYPDSEMIVSPNAMYKLRQFYDLKFRYEGQSYETWVGALADRYRSKAFLQGQIVTYEGKQHSVVTYLRSFGTKEHPALVLFLIDNTQIQNMLRRLSSGDGGFAFIQDEHGQTISQSGVVGDTSWSEALSDGFSEADIDGRRMLVTRSTSDYNGWTYVSAQPEAAVLEKVQYLRRLLSTILALGLLAGMAAALLFAYRNSRPLWMLLRTLPTAGRTAGSETAAPARNAWDEIRSSVTNLVHRNGDLEEKLELQMPLLRSGFYDRLLRGYYASNQDIAVAMEHARVSWEGEFHAVGLLEISGYDGGYNEEMLRELDIRKLGVRDVLAKSYGRTIAAHDLSENQIALLMNGDADSAAAFMDKLRRILGELRERFANELHVAVHVSVGGCCRRLTDISRSFEEARLLMQRESWSSERAIVFQDDASPAMPTYFYPPDVELRLVNLVASGNVTETDALLEQIRDNNLVRQSLPAAVGRILLGELSGTLLKCIGEAGSGLDPHREEIERALLAVETGKPPKAAFDEIAGAFLSICRSQNDRKKSHNLQLKDDLIRYIEENYHRTDLSLGKLAEHTQTSEAYISYFFKEQTGVNFSDYLERLRMTHARTLLEGSDAPVNEIAVAVGYYSLNTFSRAFKRANGLSATEYRKSRKPQDGSGF